MPSPITSSRQNEAPKRPSPGRSSRAQLAVMALPWVMFAFVNIAFKLWIFYSRPGTHAGWVQGLGVLRWDLLLMGVLVPLGSGCLLALLPARWQLKVSVALADLALVLLCLDVAIFRTLGTFVPINTILNLLHWLFTTGDTHVLVVPFTVVVPLVVVLAIALVMSWAVLRGRENTQRVLAAISVGVIACCTVLGLCAFIPRAEYPEFTPPLLKIAVQQAFARPAANAAVIGKSLPQLMQMYRTSANTPPADLTYAAKARGYNVVFFVMESLPAEVFDPAGDVHDMPNVGALREHAFVSRRHYTTYPYTSYACFALLSSMYIQTSPGTLIEDPKLAIPGVIGALRETGYATGYYGFVWKNLYARDDRMLANMGFEKFADPTTNPNNDLAAKEMYVGPARAAISHDSQALAMMRTDINAWSAKQQPFVAAYFPELGHDPWRDLDPGSHKTPLEVGHALAVRHDQWLGELVEELRADGILDKTIIVVTSDHGERLEHATAAEASTTISPDRLDDRAFRVPLLVYVPGVLTATQWIDGPTSHIDLQPTVLSLLGVDHGRNLEQGSEIWNARLAERKLFLATVGAEGYCIHGTCYSAPNLGPPQKASGLNFDNAPPLPSDSAEAAEVKHSLAEHHVLQHAILDQVLHTSRAE